MTRLAIIAGSGLSALKGLEITRQQQQQTPYGEPSAALIYGIFAGKEIIFLPRHGEPHVIPPHKVNYRANIWGLKENDVDKIISINAVGGITETMHPGTLVVPDQIIDYTWSRAHTFFEDDLSHVTHVEFTAPYSEELRHIIINTAELKKLDISRAGTYGATQGPRLESAAEIARMQRDGCDIVGMTGMPETALARELELSYASISIVANWAAGKSEEAITMEMIEKNMQKALVNVQDLLAAVIRVI
ncbi:MAG: S-methyl-5'-thioinosine phosphorylase [Gammaproteobacteria bacterium]